MNLANGLYQLRQGIKKVIDANPANVVFMRKPMKDNGLGEMVEDPYGTPDATAVRVRISKERRGPEGSLPIEVGLSTAGSFYMLSDYQTPIFKNDTFEWSDRRWRLDAVSRIEQMGGVIAYEAPIIQAEEEPTT